MAYYRNEPAEKAYNVFSEKVDAILVASVSLAPHQEYDRDTFYNFKGLGSMFDGKYRLKKVVHTINTGGYFVEAEARMAYDIKGNPVEGGYKKAKAPTNKKADKTYVVKSGDTLWGIASRLCKSALDWKDIEKANHKLLVSRDKRNASDLGHWIYPGQKLTIPGSILK